MILWFYVHDRLAGRQFCIITCFTFHFLNDFIFGKRPFQDICEQSLIPNTVLSWQHKHLSKIARGKLEKQKKRKKKRQSKRKSSDKRKEILVSFLQRDGEGNLSNAWGERTQQVKFLGCSKHVSGREWKICALTSLQESKKPQSWSQGCSREAPGGAESGPGLLWEGLSGLAMMKMKTMNPPYKDSNFRIG